MLTALSLGEFAALAISGALSIETALRMVAFRAQSMVRECIAEASGMLACEMSPAMAEEMMLSNAEVSESNVACRNSKNDCVIAGPLDQLKSLGELCKSQKIKAKLLDVPYGFHSHAMDPIVKDLEELGQSIEWSNPSIPILSGVSGGWVDEELCDSSYFARHARQPVLFAECINTLAKRGFSAEAIFIEVGPHPITLPMIYSTLSSSQPCVATLRKSQEAWKSLTSMLSSLHTQLDKIDWRDVFAGSDAGMTELPGYPLQLKKFEVPYCETPQERQKEERRLDKLEKTGYKLLPKVGTLQRDKSKFVLETDVECLGPLILGHKVNGTALCPASVFHELALEAGRILLDVRDDEVIAVENLTFQNPLIYDPSEGSTPVRLEMTKGNAPIIASFKITYGHGNSNGEKLCSTGLLSCKERADLETQWKRHSAMVQRFDGYLNEGTNNNMSIFQKSMLYDHIFARVVQYSKDYQSLSSLKVSGKLEGIGTFRVPSDSKSSGYVISPLFTDTLLHAAGFIANLQVPVETVCICTSVQSLELIYDHFDYDQPFTVYCTLYEEDQYSIVADAYGLDSFGRTVAVLYGMKFKKLKLASFQKHLHAGLSNASSTPDIDTIKDDRRPRPLMSWSENERVITAKTPSTALSETNPPTQDVEGSFRAIVATVCGMSESSIDMNVPLESLGIDSLLQIELMTKVAEAFPIAALDRERLADCGTLLAVEVEVKAALGICTAGSQSPADVGSPYGTTLSSSSASSTSLLNVSAQPVVIKQADNKAIPIFLFHDGSGQVGMYRRVGNLERNVYAFPSPRLSNPGLRHASLRNLATEYVSSLRLAVGNQPVILAGWSFGGVVAFEAARQLVHAGTFVQGLILIDAPLPVDHNPLPQKLIQCLFGRTQSETQSESSTSSSSGAMFEQFRYHTQLLSEHHAIPFRDEVGHGIRTVILHSENTLDTERLCGVTYGWLNSEKVQEEVVQGWKVLVGEPVGVLSIPGHHFEAFDQGNVSPESQEI